MTSPAPNAKSLLPTRPRSDNSLLRPRTHESTRSRLASESSGQASTGSRKGSLVEAVEPSERIALGRVQESEDKSEGRTGEELEGERRRRKRGEENLRSALSSIGSLATDITRRLDYSYYNLLEKLSALTSTIISFRDLSTTTTGLFNDFERESAGLDQDVRKQLADLNSFQPQSTKIEALEGRMRAGREKAEDLSTRLDSMRLEVDKWEKTEVEWQKRVGWRLRVFWAVIATALVVVVAVVMLMGSPSASPSHSTSQMSTDTPPDTSPDRLRILDEL